MHLRAREEALCCVQGLCLVCILLVFEAVVFFCSGVIVGGWICTVLALSALTVVVFSYFANFRKQEGILRLAADHALPSRHPPKNNHYSSFDVETGPEPPAVLPCRFSNV